MGEDNPATGVIRESMPLPPVSDEIWKLILDRSSIPEAMIHLLKGEVWVVVKNDQGNPEGRWEKRGVPLMNDEGVRFFSTFFYSATSPDKLATFLSEEEVKTMAHEMVDSIIEIMDERGDEFGVDASNKNFIVRMLDHYYFTNLSASRKGTILAALKPMYERKEIITNQRDKKLQFPSFLG